MLKMRVIKKIHVENEYYERFRAEHKSQQRSVYEIKIHIVLNL